MPIRSIWRPAVPILALAVITCSPPTDLSPGVFVTLETSNPVLLRGEEAMMLARAWSRDASGDAVELRNVALRWSSADTRIATVEGDGRGRGRVTGVNPGLVEIRAVAPGYERSTPAVLTLRIANPLEIDSITPDTVRFGEQVTLYGIGVGELFFAGLGSGFLVSDSTSITGRKSGLGKQSFWVPWPSQTGSIFAAGSGQLVSAPAETVVLPWDLYEPNQNAPSLIDLAGPSPFPAVPQIRMFNPALAFEDLRDFPFGFDWYRLRSADVATPLTLFFSAPALAGAHATYLTDQLRPSGLSDAAEWRIGSGEYVCKGFDFRPEEAFSDSVIIALARLPATTIDLVSAYLQEGRYTLAVIEGYATADPRLAPDRFEENDLCAFADDNFASTGGKLDLDAAPVAENLTIDNVHDIDWIRFRVGGISARPVAIRTAAQPFAAVDRSDVDLYVLTVPSPTNGLDLVARDVTHGSVSALDLLLNPGDYYLAVVDSAGVPTRYSLCLAVGQSCTLPTPPPLPGPAPTAGRVATELLGSLRHFTRPADDRRRMGGARR